MRSLEIRPTPMDFSHVRSLCAFMGSFDPVHRGHEWIAEELLRRFDAVLLLVPALHFEKTVRFPLNATLEQRLNMLAFCIEGRANRIAAGLTHEVLFIRLADRLAEHFPSAEITFAMGNDTFERFLRSKAYYERSGFEWNGVEQSKLEQLAERIVVFGRSKEHDRYVAVPQSLRRLSSTRVREEVTELRKRDHSETKWQERLESMVKPRTVEFIRQEGLYCSIEDLHGPERRL